MAQLPAVDWAIMPFNNRSRRPPAHAATPSGPSEESASQEAEKAGPWRSVLEVAGVVVSAAILALLLRAFVVQVYKIPSESMADTLDVGSRIAVNHVPGWGKQVERGDVVVFRDSEGWLTPAEGSGSIWSKVGSWFGFAPEGGEQIVVKRVIGVGGDTVSCCGARGELMVNGVPVEETYLASEAVPAQGEFTVQVPEGFYWVMGDNRQNSADSLYHYQLGQEAFVPAESIIGRAQWEIWPLNRWSYLGNRDVFEDVPTPGKP